MIEAKTAAAVAAVYGWLARAKAGGQADAPPAGAQAASQAAGGSPSPWALYGRQAIMSQRVRLQARRRA